MKELINKIIEIILDFRIVAGDILVPNLPLFYIISIVISLLLIWGIVFAVIRSGWLTYQYDRWSDILGVGDIGKRRQLRAWKQIVARVKTDDMNNWKTAILEADKIFDDILKMSGYRGDTEHERFQQLPPEALSNRDRILVAHEIRDKILREPEFVITRAQAVDILRIYQRAFQELGLIE